MMFLTAAGFVLTFEQPSSPDASASEELERKGESSMDTLYDDPLNSPKYGNNTMSKVVAEALSGDASNMTETLNITLPEGLAYNVYLNNGYGVFPLYEGSGDPPEEAQTSERLLEPKWTYTFLSTDLDEYPPASDGNPLKMGVFSLPVAQSTPTAAGGTQVEVVVKGQVHNDAMGTNSFALDTNHRVVQAESGTLDPLPHASVTFVDTAGGPDPIAYKDETSSHHEGDYSVLVNETAGVSIPEGTNLTVNLPRGVNATASNETSDDWDVVRNKTDNATRGDLVLELNRSVSDGTLQANFSAEWWGTEYDFHVLRARLADPGWGTARLLVQRNASSTFTGGDLPDIHVSGPRTLGEDSNGTWAFSVKHPTPSASLTDETDQTMEVETVEVIQKDGLGIFEDVEPVSSSCGGTWTVESPSHLKWDADPSGDTETNCELGENGVLEAAFEVESSGNGTPRDEDDPLEPPVSYDNGYEDTVDVPIGIGFNERQVPANLSGIPDTELNTGRDWDGWQNSLSGEATIESHTTYLNLLASLQGNTTYTTSSYDTFKDGLSLGRVSTGQEKVAVGGDVRIDTNVQALLMALAEKGMSTTLETNIYPPWSVGEREPIETIEHLARGTSQTNVIGLATHDVTGDGEPDVLLGTTESRALALDGDDGTKVTGVQETLIGQDATIFEKAKLDTNHVRFLLGFQGLDADELYALDTNLDVDWSQDLGASGVEDLTHDNDYTGDGIKDVGVILTSGQRFLLDGDDGSVVWRLGPHKAPELVDEGVVGWTEEQSILSTRSAKDPTSTDMNRTGAVFNQSGESINPVQSTADFLKSVTISTQSAGLIGTAADNGTTFRWRGESFGEMATSDLGSDGITDIMAGRYNGVLQALNGSQANAPLSWLTILSGNTIPDAEVMDRRHVVTVTSDGMFYWTDDAWTTTNYYWGDSDLNIYPFPHAVGVDVPLQGEAWVVHGLSGTDISYAQSNYYDFQELDYTVYEDYAQENPVNLTDTHEWADIKWHGSLGVDGILYGGSCEDLLDVDIDNLTSDLDCPDAYIAYNHPEHGDNVWVEANISGGAEDHKIQDVHFPPEGDSIGYNADVGYAVGNNSGFYRTTDSGENWQRYEVDPNGTVRDEDLHDVYFNDTNDGFVVGEDGVVFRTTDGGETWTEIETPVSTRLRGIDFLASNESKGWVVGNGTTVLKTTDGGDTWVDMTTPDPEDMAPWEVGPTLYDVGVPAEDIGWVFGGNADDAEVTRTIGHLGSWVKNATVKTTVLDSVTNISEVKLHGDKRENSDTGIEAYVSNDGCGSWMAIQWKPKNPAPDESPPYDGDWWKEFDDNSTGDLCFKAHLTVDQKLSDLYSSRIHGLKLSYNHSTDGGETWQKTTLDVDLTNMSNFDESETTAVVNTTVGQVRAPLVDKLWQTTLDGAPDELLFADVQGDSRDELVVGTGDEWATQDRVHRQGKDRRVYTFDPGTGHTLEKSAEFPGRVTQIETANLDDATSDSKLDLLVTVRGDSDPNDDKTVDRVYAVNGATLDKMWNVSLPEYLRDVTSDDLNADGDTEAVVGTDANGTETHGSGVVKAIEADQNTSDSPNSQQGSPTYSILWTSYPGINENYTFTYNVPRGLPFGPFVVESQVSWESDTLEQKNARVYDSFVVVPPDRDLPESPLYRVELVSWYQGG